MLVTPGQVSNVKIFEATRAPSCEVLATLLHVIDVATQVKDTPEGASGDIPGQPAMAALVLA